MLTNISPQVSYLAHQVSLANLLVSSQVLDLSLEPRARYSAL